MTEKEKWTAIQDFFKTHFTDTEIPDVEGMLFLIGVQELGQGYKKFKKDDKINLMHIAVCRLLEPYGYYRFSGRDQDDWPHFELIETLPKLKANEQQLFIKKAIIRYFEEQELLGEGKFTE